MYATFGDYPRVWVIGTALWLALLMLNLPLSLNAFRKATTASIVAVFAVGIWTLVMAGHFAVTDWQSWLITLILLGGCLMTWWNVSVPLWRWYRSTTPTDSIQDQGAADHPAA